MEFEQERGTALTVNRLLDMDAFSSKLYFCLRIRSLSWLSFTTDQKRLSIRWALGSMSEPWKISDHYGPFQS